MKKLLAGIFLGCFAAAAYADLTIVQEVESAMPDGTMRAKTTVTMRVKGSKFKIEFNGNRHVLIDMAAGKMWMAENATRTIKSVDISALKEAARAMQAASGAQESRQQIQKTENTKTIGGFKCREYKIEASGTVPEVNGAYWATEDADVSELDALKEYIKDISSVFGMEAFNAIKGLPVESDITYTSGAKKIRTTTKLKSFSRDEIAASVFELPADHTVAE